jgi:fructose-bisphosphate aldolase, class II
MLPGMSGAIGLPGEVVSAPTDEITAAVREALAGEPAEWDPRHATKAARQGMREVVAERMRQFGQAGHAADHLPLSLERIRERHVAAAAAA